jgi:hypothetical protein
MNSQSLVGAQEASHHTAPATAVAEHEAHRCAMHSREASAREATVADLPTVMRRAEEEAEAGSQEATTPPPAARPARVTHSREENAREAMPAVTTTVRRVLETLLPATTVVVTDPVVCVSLSRKESVSAERPVASPTKLQSPPVTTLEATKLWGDYLLYMRSIAAVLLAGVPGNIMCDFRGGASRWFPFFLVCGK